MSKLKRILCMSLVLIIIFVGVVYASEVNNDNKDLKSIESKLIRFHVIASSDSIEDQALKLKVRDKVLEYISPKLKESNSIEESRKILKENDENIIKICETVIRNNGYVYGVKTTLSKENFPVKVYGNITLPQGNYEAYRILIGDGNGKNWWCVMFPPLCFVDISKGEVSYDKTKAQMENVLSSKEYAMVENRKPKEKIKVKFKLIEIIRNFRSKNSPKPMGIIYENQSSRELV
jgi:stage II sporulation protein R